MSDEWADSDDPRLRALCGYALRAHVRYQDGRDSLAPALVFADADYEVGDGTCGLHPEGKQANEPAIVYARADALVDMADRIAALEAERDNLRQQYEFDRVTVRFAVNAADAAESENRKLREALEAIARHKYGLQSIQEETSDANRYNYLKAEYFQKQAFSYQLTARAALAETEGE